MTFKIITLGCKVNTYESEIISEQLLAAGYKLDVRNPKVVIINTCSVTNNADSKSKKIIRGAKKNHPEAILIVCGCTAENHQEELNDLNIDILIGNKDKSKLVEYIEEFQKNNQKIIKFYDRQKSEFEDMKVQKFTSHTRAFLKIQDGCNNYCSYCIIPYLRGNLKSKDIDIAYNEVVELVKNNHQEIVLTGIHTGSYGIGTSFDLVDLIKKMSTINGLKRIRISSIEITELNEKFLEELKINPKICDHLHIPLQAGSDRVLKIMNRKYNKEFFKEKIETIRNIRPNINITTDVIVGFPSETEEEFKETVKFCEELKISKIHTFPYSKRVGTKACEIEGHLSTEVKKERAKKLIEVSEKLENEYSSKYLNQELEVLVEENNEDFSIGHTSNYLKVYINQELAPNSLINVTIKKVEERIEGEINVK